jgi:hypothetical protein
MEKKCRNCERGFFILQEDLDYYARLEVPPPTWCPFCRHIRRHGHINDYVYYQRKCDQCDKSMISIYPEKTEYTVYCVACWFSDDRDDSETGRDYDFTRSFFAQFSELLKDSPQVGLSQSNCENCEYAQSIADCRNCYLISESSNNEDCMYSYWIQVCKDTLDGMYLQGCEKCYEVLNCFDSYNLKYSQNCINCSDSAFLDNCIGCRNCLFSTNLRQKEYCIFNRSYSKEDYFAELEKLQLDRYDQVELLRVKFQEFLKNQPRKALQTEQLENSSGDYMKNAKNCSWCFHCYDAEDCKYGEHVWRGAKNCMDANTAGRNAELIYESTNCGIDTYRLKFSRYCWGSKFGEYSNECKGTQYIFGCSSLKPGAKYRILNKQYRENEWYDMVGRIREKMRVDGEYGEFFPLSISMYGYNDSVSFDEWSLTKEQVLAKGWKWEDAESGSYGKGTIDMGIGAEGQGTSKDSANPFDFRSGQAPDPAFDISKDSANPFDSRSGQAPDPAFNISKSSVNHEPASSILSQSIADINEGILKEVLTCAKCEKNYKVIAQELKFYKENSVPVPRKCFDCRHRERLARRNKKVFQSVQCAKCGKETHTTLDLEKYPLVYCEGCYSGEVY